MIPQHNLAQQIIDTNSFEKAIKIIQNINSIEEKQKVFQDLQQILLSSENNKLAYSLNFKLKLTQYVISYSQAINPKLFKTQNIFQLIALTKGYFSLSFEKQKIRSHFVKALKKELSFWGLQTLQAFKDNLISRDNGYRSLWSSTSYLQEIQRLQYLLNFYQDNIPFFPANLQIRNYFVKYLLIIRHENQNDKKIFQRIQKIYLDSNYSLQILKNNFRFCLEFFRNSYNEKQYLYCPYKSIIQLLSNFKKYQIQELIIRSGSLGLIWQYQNFSCCILNTIKNAGITEHSVRIMKSFIQLAKNHKKFSQIIKTFENNIAKIFIFLKHPKLFPVSFDLLCQFILGPPATTSLYASFMDKAKSFAKIIQKDNLKDYLLLLQAAQLKYKQNTITTQIDIIIQIQVKNGYQRSDSQSLKKKLNQYDWRIFDQKKSEQNKIVFENDKNQEPTNYKGLVNIGNSCYMNSFLQCLFMTKEFRRELLKTSTLQLQKQALVKLHQQYQGEKDVQVTTIARERVRPVAQLQRLFALLSRSQRPAVNPSSFKNAGPIQFKNTYQQDSSQYGRSLFQIIHHGHFPHFFQGQMTIQIQCPSCNTKRNKKEQFVDLMLHNQQEQQSLQKMVQTSFNDEDIQGLTCDSCEKKSQKSIKKHWISKLPNYLILTIKRFQYSKKQNKNIKKQFKVKIDQTFKIGQEFFQIYGIIVHRGGSANSGHYFAFCRQNLQTQSKWLCLNDSQVDAMTNFHKVIQFLDMCPQDTPYILFSQRISHINEKKKELEQSIILRLPLQKYVEKDNIEYVKQNQKKPLFNLGKLNFNNNFYGKRDDDSDQQGGRNNGFNNFNAPII